MFLIYNKNVLNGLNLQFFSGNCVFELIFSHFNKIYLMHMYLEFMTFISS